MGPLFFIRRPKFAFVISLLITLFGLLTLQVMPIDQYPDIAAPKVVVRANYPGADAQTVLQAVATPIEDEVNGAEGMAYMESKAAADGSYTLTVTFETGVDADLAQVDVQNRVALAEPGLPAEVRQRGIRVRKRNPDILMVVNVVSPDGRFDGCSCRTTPRSTSRANSPACPASVPPRTSARWITACARGSIPCRWPTTISP